MFPQQCSVTVDPEQSLDYKASTTEPYRHMQQSFSRTFSGNPETAVDVPQLLCDFEGCKSKPFRRRGDLKRHQLDHNSNIVFNCPADDCSRTGSKGFKRLDKLKDHVLGGHKRETHFRCLAGWHQGLRTLPHTLPRDLFAIHMYYRSGLESRMLYSTMYYRDCPIPRCHFRINVSKERTLDSFQVHLTTKHSFQWRTGYTSFIGSRGYDATTGNVVCPICTKHFQYPGHSAFYRHLIDAHLNGLALPEAVRGNIKPHSNYTYGLSMDVLEVGSALRSCTQITEEIRQHHRTILSLWPLFEVHPVFDEIRNGPY